jgi:hypothetical protein
MSAITSGRSPQVLKWVFFGAMALATLLVIHADETFLVSPADPEWRHIAPFKWPLLPHALAGAAALFTGPLQFSDRLRANRPRLHRWTGRIYIGAICHKHARPPAFLAHKARTRMAAWMLSSGTPFFRVAA